MVVAFGLRRVIFSTPSMKYSYSQDEFISSRWPLSGQTSARHGALNAGHLNAARYTPQVRQRAEDRGLGTAVLQSCRSSSFEYAATKPAAILFHLERYAHQSLETVGSSAQLFATG